MKSFFWLGFVFLILFSSLVLAQTKCTYMGEEIPCDEMPAFPIFIIIGIIFFIFIFVLLVIIFWIFMLIDCVKRDFKDSNEKIVWVLVLVFTSWIGAIIYYFVVKRG